MNGPHLQRIELTDLGALRVKGADAVRFLQGQLSNDLGRLGAQRSVLAGLHNPQGRTIALLRVVQLAPQDLLAVLPRELAAPVASRLAKYVLRAKATITEESRSWRLTGLIAASASAPLGEYPSITGEQRRLGHGEVICVGEHPARWLRIAPAADAQTEGSLGPDSLDESSSSAPAPRESWRRLDIIAGMPQVYGATSEQFVAQMLNLDVIGAIAFDKGCYTGQEVIARAHYRGRVKRRLQRFRSRHRLDLKPGDSGELADGRAFTVVEAVCLEDGRCEFLAVAPLPSLEPQVAGMMSDAPLERVNSPRTGSPVAAEPGSLTGGSLGAPATGAALHAAVPSELSTTGAVWAPFATSTAAGPQMAGASAPQPHHPGKDPRHELEPLDLPYALPE
jgi:folate-binding protein YgfZ